MSRVTCVYQWVVALLVLLGGLAPAATAQQATVLNPTGYYLPESSGTISRTGERDYWLFWAPASGRALFYVGGSGSSRLNSRITVVDPSSGRVITGPVDGWGWGLTEQVYVNVAAGRWYGIIVDGLGARAASEATGSYSVGVSAPYGPGMPGVRPAWPGNSNGGSAGTPVYRTIATWQVTRRPGQDSRRSDDSFVGLARYEQAEIVITGVPDSVKSSIRFTLMHDKRNASDQARTSSIGNGSPVAGSAHDWPGFGNRIYIGRLNMPWSLDSFFRVYPRFTVTLRVRVR